MFKIIIGILIVFFLLGWFDVMSIVFMGIFDVGVTFIRWSRIEVVRVGGNVIVISER
jgi:hypothetical protein